MPRALSHPVVVSVGALILISGAGTCIAFLLPGYIDSTFDEPVYTYTMNVSAV